MSRFYASIQGSRGEVTRMGGKKSGIDGHIRGWDLGIRVRGYVDEKGNDCFGVYRTSGSNSGKSERLITTVKKI